MNSPLRGRTALVTGGHRGIGFSVSGALLAAGSNVVMVGRAEDQLTIAATSLQADGYKDFLALVADVRSESDVERTFAAAEERFGPVGVLVCNAGLNDAPIPVADMSLEEWERSYRNNATSVFLCVRRAIPAMRSAGYGRIITLSSRAGVAGGILSAPGERAVAAQYAASKAAIIGFTRAVARELAGTGITANAVTPGPIATDRYRERLGAVLPQVPVGRLGGPEDVADAVLYLAADRGFVTGQALHVNGGTWIG